MVYMPEAGNFNGASGHLAVTSCTLTSCYRQRWSLADEIRRFLRH
jgi:hypothetical protein